jgi:hypothetical protein
MMRKNIAAPLKLAQQQAMAVAGMAPDGRHRSIDHPKVLRTPPDSPHRVRASYHTPRPLTLVPNQLPNNPGQQQVPGGPMIYRPATANPGPGHNYPPRPGSEVYYTPAEQMVAPGYGPDYQQRPLHPHTRQLTRQSRLRGSAENLVGKVLEEHGLDRYVDPACIRQELADATDMTVEELDAAAHELMQQRTGTPTPANPAGAGHPYGYNMHEMKDYNKYPQQLPPNMAHQHQQQQHLRGYRHPDYPDDNDDMVYVTTL